MHEQYLTSSTKCFWMYITFHLLKYIGKKKGKEWSIGFTPQQFFQPFVVKEL